MSKTFKQIKTELADEKKKVQQCLSTIKKLAKDVSTYRKRNGELINSLHHEIDTNTNLEQKLCLTECLLKTKL